jgi:ATP-dependent exoDNAse (exonuclease V) beta subunit
VSRSSAGNPKYAAWGVLNDFLADATELAVSDAATPPAVALLDCSNAAQQEAETSCVAAHERSRQRSWTIASVTADTPHIARVTRSLHADVDDPTRVVRTDTPGRRADAGMAWGSLIHGLLEHAMRHRAATRDDLRRLAMWLTVEEPQLRASLDDAIETVLRVAQSEFWQNAKAGEHLEETPFMVARDLGVLTNGIVDLLFNTGNGWRIRDYKTDLSLDASEYDGQLNAYWEALEKMNYHVIDASLIHVRKDQQ